MTRIVGLLSWFDESPTRLAACITGMARVCDHIVALDGRYELYHDPRNRSSTAEYDAILQAAHAAGVSITVQGSMEPWRDEMHKRTHLFRLGALACDEFTDWMFVCDADEVVAEAPPREHVCQALDEARIAGFDSAAAMLWEKADPAEHPERERASARFPIEYRYETPQRRFWRNLRNLRVVGYHYNYVGEREDGRTVELWGSSETVKERAPMSQALVELVTIENRNRMRAQVRNQSREAYYALRDKTQAEPLRVLHEYDEEQGHGTTLAAAGA
jgi:hypothetical protein